MKKTIIITLSAFAFGGVAFAALNSWLPSRTQIQSNVYAMAQGTLHSAKLSYDKAVKDEQSAFCLLVDLKHADRIELTDPKSVERYSNNCTPPGLK